MWAKTLSSAVIASFPLITMVLASQGRGSFRVPLRSSHVPPVLLFTGEGASPNDVLAVEAVLDNRRLHYSTVDSSQLNGMTTAQLRAYRLLIIPGGNFEKMSKSLKLSTMANIRDGVRSGLNYLGICAGAILGGDTVYHNTCLNLTNGVGFDFYGVTQQGIHKAAVPISVAESGTFDHYWEDGPQLTGWGRVVGRYPDGTPAIVEGESGRGWVVLSGIHAEAPESWRHGMTFATPTEVCNAYAGTLLLAALNRARLPHY